VNKKKKGKSIRRIDRLCTKNWRPPEKKAKVGAPETSLICVTMGHFTYGKKIVSSVNKTACYINTKSRIAMQKTSVFGFSTTTVSLAVAL
jgi:hypothetical protein